MATDKPIGIKDVRPRGRDVFPVDWPGGTGSINLMLLRCEDVQAAHWAAVRVFQDAGQTMEGPSYNEFLREKELQEVYRMLLRPDARDPKARLFKLARDARDELDLNEIAWWQQRHTVLTDQVLLERGMIAKEEEAEKEAEGDAD